MEGSSCHTAKAFIWYTLFLPLIDRSKISIYKAEFGVIVSRIWSVIHLYGDLYLCRDWTDITWQCKPEAESACANGQTFVDISMLSSLVGDICACLNYNFVLMMNVTSGQGADASSCCSRRLHRLLFVDQSCSELWAYVSRCWGTNKAKLVWQ